MEYYRMEHLELEIRNYISDIAGKKYIAPIEVLYDDGVYVLYAGLGSKENRTITLGMAGTEEEFLNYVCKELRKRISSLTDISSTKLVNGNSNQFYPLKTI